MISHEVIVHKDPVYTSPIQVGAQRAYPDIKSQEDLDKFWAEGKFAKGDYVTYMPVGGLSENSQSSVYRIIELQTSFATMQIRNYSPYHPVLVRIQSLPTSSQLGYWDRWDDLRNLRKLHEHEIDKTVRPYLDRVRGNSQSQA